MKWIGKLAGGVLGALAMGPIGAALGVLVGHQIDEQSEAEQPALPGEELTSIGERFFRATFRIMGYLAKSDGRVSEQEIAAARAVMAELRLGSEQVSEAIGCFREGKAAGFDFQGELATLGRACRGRPDLARIFLEIQVRAALAGNNLQGPVRALLAQVAASLGISAFEFAHIEAVLRIQRAGHAGQGQASGARRTDDVALAEAYRVLETTAAASDAEVAKAYRRQLQRHHPDKLKANGLPDSMLAHAKQRTQQIIEAWELVRERRGIR
ncbi:MAG: co-chaperone DjlA [Proteobacteria bacterium]|nr:co-chaperone DjlA [Pseudomonadota bacterium]